MTAADRELDLRGATPAAVRGQVFRAVEELQTGETLAVHVDHDPELALQAANLYLRHRLSWETESTDTGWIARVRIQSEDEAKTLTDLLTLDHQRVDRLFAEVLRRANAGDMAGARAFADAFDLALKRHVHVENELLAATFSELLEPHGGDPVSVMVREHEEIVTQLDEIRALLQGGDENLLELQVLAGMLSGQLAKHEGREEQNVFPLWESALRRYGEQRLFERAREIIGGADDATVLGNASTPNDEST